MKLDSVPDIDVNKKNQEIVFDGGTKLRDVFNLEMDSRLEIYKRRTAFYADKYSDPENNLNYLENKYKIHIANKIRFGSGVAKYGEIFNSLNLQDQGVNEEIYDKAWNAVRRFVEGEEDESEIKISTDCGKFIYGEVFEDSSLDNEDVDWQETGIKVIDTEGHENEDGFDKVLSFIKNKFGRNKKIRSL